MPPLLTPLMSAVAKLRARVTVPDRDESPGDRRRADRRVQGTSGVTLDARGWRDPPVQDEPSQDASQTGTVDYAGTPDATG
jgi:hypothetical protein